MKVTFPKFTSSDRELDATYRYRSEVYGKHVKETADGYVVTEFLPPVPWAGKHNTICCATLHHIREGRWMHESRVLEDYLHFWCLPEITPREWTNRYSLALADAYLDYVKVTGDHRAAMVEYRNMEEIHHAWDARQKDGLYFQSCGYDGMEYSISGDGRRPTVNSYMYADKMALSYFARRMGDEEKAETYRREAEMLRARINACLWNEKIQMYGVLSEDGLLQNVREQIGYVPFTYGIPDGGKDGCFRNLFDPACFLAPYGIRTADASHPEYMKPFDHECLWNGPVWPFATSQTLTALIAYLNTARAPKVTADEFMSLLTTYSLSQRDENGEPWIDEDLHPDTGVWLAREIMRESGREDKERGIHYNHSTFIDLVITGVCGIQPSADDTLVIRPLGTSLDFFSLEDVRYHGHTLSVRFEKSKGLFATLDGEQEFFCPPSGDLALTLCSL